MLLPQSCFTLTDTVVMKVAHQSLKFCLVPGALSKFVLISGILYGIFMSRLYGCIFEWDDTNYTAKKRELIATGVSNPSNPSDEAVQPPPRN